MSVLPTTAGFIVQRWATQQGGLIDGMLWFVGEFNGDAKDDLAFRWNDGGKIAIDVFVAHVIYYVFLRAIVR